MKNLTFVALALVGMLVACTPAAQFALSPPSQTPTKLQPTHAPENEAFFRSDEFHLEVSLPPGWAAVEGPQYLAKPFSGWAAFNSWGEPGFWITVVEKETDTGMSYSYNPRDILDRIPERGAYIFLIDQAGGPPFMEEDYGPERVQDDLADLWRDQDCRREGDPLGFTMLNFYKWGRFMRLKVYCAPQATDETAAQVNSLLASWRFDAVPAGDVGWASVAARELLPAAVEPKLFPYLTDSPHLSSSQRDEIVRMTQSEKPAEDRVTITFMVRWKEPPLTSTSWDCPSDRCHWWRIEARPDGEVVLMGEGGAPLSSPTPTLTQPSSSTTAQSDESVLLPSPDGRWTAILSREAGSLELEDPQGVKQTVFPAGSTVNDAQWSADGKRLAVASTNLPKDWQYGDEAKTPPEIHFLDFDGDAFLKAGIFYRAHSEAVGGRILLRAWSPDNRRILFWLGSMSASIQADGFPLWVLDLSTMEATRLAEVTLVNPGYQSWAPDGSALVFTNGGYRSAQVGKWMSLYEVAKGQVTTLVPEDNVVPGAVAWSPVGVPIAFAAVEASQTGGEWADWMSWDNPAILARRIYLLDPQNGEYRRLNAAEAYQDAPRWSAHGEKLYYIQIEGNQAVLMAADPDSGEAQPLPGCRAPLPSGAGYYGQTDWTDLYENCPEAVQSIAPALSNPSITGQAQNIQQIEAIDAIPALFGLPDLPLEFVETTTMMNSPEGDLAVARYQDSEGRNYFVEPERDQVVEIDARAALSAISPDALLLSQDELSAKAEELIRGAIPDIDPLQAGLSYEEGVKEDYFFFTWRATHSSGSMNRPFAQIGLHKSGELFAYYNTLTLMEQAGATITGQIIAGYGDHQPIAGLPLHIRRKDGDGWDTYTDGKGRSNP